MSTSELLTSQHLKRKAIIYIRQSTPHQVLTNQESFNLQYALKQRALSLGWRDDDIEIIDSDLGLTAALAQHREGFKDLVTKVTLGQVGIIFSSEVSRLARNNSDWYQLLDICGFKGCLIADRDGIYDPATPNGRLILGLKGTLSEMELHTIKTRMHAGLLNKAERGDLALHLPIGLVRDELGSFRLFFNVAPRARSSSISINSSCSYLGKIGLAIWFGSLRLSVPSSRFSKIRLMPEPSFTGEQDIRPGVV
jgi:DNA invertase Pin-like site-specific DNA recombinase